MTDSYSILIIEDEKNILDFMARTLRSNGYKTITSETGQSGLSIINSQCPDLILLDLGLPDMDGNDIISSVRKWTSCPIIIISARAGEQDKVAALDLGADDYITKPYSLPVLMARIKNTLKRTYRSETSSEIEYNGLKLDLSNCTVMYNNVCVELSKRETQILCYLLNHAGHYVSRISLIEHLWNTNQYIDDNTLSVNVTRIREKLSRLGLSGFIQTKRGMGYKV